MRLEDDLKVHVAMNSPNITPTSLSLWDEAGVANPSCQTGGTESCPSFHRDQARWEHRRVARGEDKIRRKKLSLREN